MTAIRYLHIRGTLSANNVYTPRAGHESDLPSNDAAGNPDFQLAMLDKEDHVLVTAAPEVVASMCGPQDGSARFRVRGCIPLHPDAASYELRRQDVVLHRCKIPAAPETNHLKPRYERKGNTFSLAWKHGANDTHSYSVFARMDDGRHYTLIRNLKATKYDVDLNRIPAEGDGRVFVVVNDGVRSSEVEVAPFSLEPRPRQIHIISPAAGSRWPFGQPISVLGSCHDASGQPHPTDSLTWQLDGQIVARDSLVAVIEEPTAGLHTLTFGYGPPEQPQSTSVEFAVDDPDVHYHEWLAVMRGPEPTSY